MASRLLVVSVRAEACSEAPLATAWLEEAICPAEALSWSTVPATWARASCSASAAPFTEVRP